MSSGAERLPLDAVLVASGVPLPRAVAERARDLDGDALRFEVEAAQARADGDENMAARFERRAATARLKALERLGLGGGV